VVRAARHTTFLATVLVAAATALSGCGGGPEGEAAGDTSPFGTNPADTSTAESGVELANLDPSALPPPGEARVEVDGEERVLGPGGVFHVESTTPRRVSNASASEDLVMLVVGGKDGYVERDGHMVDEADVERRASFGRTEAP